MATVQLTDELHVKPVEYDEELRLANELMAKSHTENYHRADEWMRTCGASYPGFQREHTRIALSRGELAGALRLSTDTVRIGEARLKMGGLGWVTTAPRHRHKGVCTALMENTLRYMREHRYHVSMLFGIPNFYHRFGYVTTLADYAVTLTTIKAARSVPTGLRVREAKPSDIPALQKIHAANDGDVACSMVRTAAHITNRWDAFHATHVLTSGHGKVLAYLRTKDEAPYITVHEVGAAKPEYFADVLAQCAAIARDRCVGQIRFFIPPDHAFAHTLLRFSSKHETQIVREEGGMMSFVDLDEALESLIPEWEHLLTRSAHRDTRCEITLLVDGKPYRVRANRGAIDIARCNGQNKCSLSGGELMQLVTGYYHADDILFAKRRIMTDESRDLFRTLLPKRNPYVWNFDRF